MYLPVAAQQPAAASDPTRGSGSAPSANRSSRPRIPNRRSPAPILHGCSRRRRSSRTPFASRRLLQHPRRPCRRRHEMLDRPDHELRSGNIPSIVVQALQKLVRDHHMNACAHRHTVTHGWDGTRLLLGYPRAEGNLSQSHAGSTHSPPPTPRARPVSGTWPAAGNHPSPALARWLASLVLGSGRGNVPCRVRTS
jgi:hypothetical protein